jgi:hypothetical protein
MLGQKIESREIRLPSHDGRVIKTPGKRVVGMKSGNGMLDYKPLFYK